MLISIISIVVVAIIINVLVNYISRRVDKEPCAPNFLPDSGVDVESLSAVPALIEKSGVLASSRFGFGGRLPSEIRAFFDKYQMLRVDGVIHLSREFFDQTYKANLDFVRFGLMNEEDDLLVRRSGMDSNIYIVGCEDGDWKEPELLATSFDNLMAIAWRNYKRSSSM